MYFEYLIRAAYKCGRYGAPGANADIYRNFEHACYSYDHSNELSPKDKESAIIEYGKYLGIVTTHIEHAIDKILKEYKNKITPKQEKTLKGLENLVLEPSKENIEKYFKEIEDIFLELKIYPLS